jgi:hypothetical protein
MATEPPKQRKRARALPVPNALAFSVEDAQAMSGLGKTTIYELMNTGRLKGDRRYAGGRRRRSKCGAQHLHQRPKIFESLQ